MAIEGVESVAHIRAAECIKSFAQSRTMVFSGRGRHKNELRLPGYVTTAPPQKLIPIFYTG